MLFRDKSIPFFIVFLVLIMIFLYGCAGDGDVNLLTATPTSTLVLGDQAECHVTKTPEPTSDNLDKTETPVPTETIEVTPKMKNQKFPRMYLRLAMMLKIMLRTMSGDLDRNPTFTFTDPTRR